MHTAHLRCGVVLTFRAPSFVPGAGQAVPCPRHGYCVVDTTGRTPVPARRTYVRATAPRSPAELLEWLRDHPRTTIHALRRHRFTLRLVTAAAREGLVEVDLDAGTVSARSPGGRPLPGRPAVHPELSSPCES